MTEKELITKLQGLKHIQPDKRWAFSLKTQILGETMVVPVMPAPFRKTLFSSVLNVFFRKELAYAFSVLLFVLAGTFGFNNRTLSNDILANLAGWNSKPQETDFAVAMENFKKRYQDLALIVKEDNKSEIPAALAQVKTAANTLADAVQKDPALAKAIALQVKNNGTLLTIDGQADVKESSDVLYKILDEQMIADLEKTTLTEGQQNQLGVARALYNEGEYAKALEIILLINN